MQPSKTTVLGLFSSPYQYQVPIFQRGYVWTLEKQVVPLWGDIQDRADAWLDQQAIASKVSPATLKPLPKHFLGSIVMTPLPNSFGRVPAYEVIDGQQRSTTLHLLLLAFKHAAARIPESPVPKMLAGLIRNPGPYSQDDDFYKVWPTQAGQDEMRMLCSASTVGDIYAAFPAREGRRKIERPLMVQTFLYLHQACLAYLRGIDLGDAVPGAVDRTYSDRVVAAIRGSNDFEELQPTLALDPLRAQALYMTLEHNIQLMTLSLEAEDDPQVIFETLNARGEPLLASDLIRNYVFLQVAQENQSVEELYAKFWSPFDVAGAAAGKGVSANAYWREKERQGRLTYPRIDLFFFGYTVLRTQEVTLASHVFQSFKAWWQQEKRDIPRELERIVASAGYFRDLISPEGTGYVAEFARLIKALDVGTVTPLYLALRERLPVESPELRQALADLASYLTRRSVCGLTTKGYNRFFLKVLQAVTAASEPHVALRGALLAATGASERWPDDRAFRDSWFTRPVYQELKPGKTCAVLRAIEYAARGARQGSNHVPEQSGLTVEHVMPQSWAAVPDYAASATTDELRLARNIKLHTFGNLSLLTQPLNSSVSNGPFADHTDGTGRRMRGKQSELGQSALLMNTYFHRPELTGWTEGEIDARTRYLFEAARLVWSHPAQATPDPVAVARWLSGRS